MVVELGKLNPAHAVTSLEAECGPWDEGLADELSSIMSVTSALSIGAVYTLGLEVEVGVRCRGVDVDVTVVLEDTFIELDALRRGRVGIARGGGQRRGSPQQQGCKEQAEEQSKASFHDRLSVGDKDQ